MHPDGDNEWARIGDNHGVATEVSGENSQAAPQHNEGGVTSLCNIIFITIDASKW